MQRFGPAIRIFCFVLALSVPFALLAMFPGADIRCLNQAMVNNAKTSKINHAHKYSDMFHTLLNLDVFFDYDEGMAYAKSVNKPVIIDFTGHACVNCRKMEANVWPDKKVYQRISQDYVLIQLYVDDKTDLAEEGKNSDISRQKY